MKAEGLFLSVGILSMASFFIPVFWVSTGLWLCAVAVLVRIWIGPSCSICKRYRFGLSKPDPTYQIQTCEECDGRGS